MDWLIAERTFALLTCFVVATPTSLGGNLSQAEEGGLPLSSGDWLIEVVEDVLLSGGFIALRVGPDDFPHVEYSVEATQYLKHGKRNRTDWDKSDVDQTRHAQTTEGLAVGPDGVPHICYSRSDIGVHVLRHAVPTESGWESERVDEVQEVTQYCSIFVDKSNEYHISYQTYWTGQLWYAHFNGTNWSTEVVDESFNVGRWSSIIISPAGAPSIAYEDYQNHTIRYASKENDRWNVSVVNPDQKYGGSIWPSLDFGPGGEPHIVYVGEAILKMASWNGSNWVDRELLPYDAPHFPSFKISSSGEPHIVYWAGSKFNYTTKTAGEWLTETLMEMELFGIGTAIDLDSNDLPHCAFIDHRNGIVYYATKANFSSNLPPVADAGGPYFGNEGTQIALDAGKSFDPDGDELEYRWDFNADGVWDTTFSHQATAVHIWNDDYFGTAIVQVRATSGPDAIKIIGDLLPGGGFVVGQEKRAQSFVATFDKASNISLDVSLNRNEVPNAPLVLAIRSELNGPDLTVAQVEGAGMPVESENWVLFDFPDIALVPGETYFVVLYSNATNAAGYQPHVTYDAYANGTAWGIGGGGVWEESPTLDIRMMILGGGATMYASDNASVSVHNLAPTADADGPYEGNEPHTVQFIGTCADPGTLDTHIFQWDFDFDGITFNVDSTEQSPTHQWQDDFDADVAFKVIDDDGGWDLDVTHVTVHNVPPEATANGPYEGFEGTPIQFKGDHTDPGPLDTHIYEWDFDYDGVTFTPDATGNPYQKTWYDDYSGKIALRVKDDDGGWGIDVTTVAIENVPPKPEWTSKTEDGTIVNPPYPEGKKIQFDTSVDDPGVNDTFTYD